MLQELKGNRKKRKSKLSIIYWLIGVNFQRKKTLHRERKQLLGVKVKTNKSSKNKLNKKMKKRKRNEIISNNLITFAIIY